jgi:carboxyl-terminal processing protease
MNKLTMILKQNFLIHFGALSLTMLMLETHFASATGIFSSVVNNKKPISFGTNNLLKAARTKPHRQMQQLDLPNGVWTSRGYGFALDVDQASNVSSLLFQETEISCVPVQELLGFLFDYTVTDDTATFDVGSAALYVFDRKDAFQSGCGDGVTAVIGDEDYVRDALHLFDIFDQTFVEHYAFFELRGIDWEAITDVARTTLTANSTDEELIDAMISVLDPLNDYHVSLQTDEVAYESKPLPILEQLYEEFEQQDDIDDYEDYEDYFSTQLGTWIFIVNSYLDNDMTGTLGEFSWGTALNGNIGYMQLFSMAPEDEESFEEDLKQAISDLSETHTMILDVRVNGGGDDLVSLKIASHFTSVPFLAFTKRAVDGDGFTEATEVYVEPSEEEYQYDGNVIVIMSGSSGSATEIFVMTMAELPQTTLVGRNTAGGLSDILGRFLPNGWFVGLSDEVYLTPDGTLYEVTGVPPEISPEADLLPLSERVEGIDSWLALALEKAENFSTKSPTAAPTTATSPDATEAPTPGPSEAPTMDDDSGASFLIHNTCLHLLAGTSSFIIASLI